MGQTRAQGTDGIGASSAARGRDGSIAGGRRGDAVLWRIAPLLCLGAIIAAFVWEFSAPTTQLDDAYISYRYALNLATGHGLVFNPGEYVEGFTNLLWTLLVALFIRLGGDGPAIGHWMSVVFGGCALAATYCYTLIMLRPCGRWIALLAPLGLLASNAFACWMTAGLETPLFLFLVVAAFIAMAAEWRFCAAGLCLLATMTRPEGALLALVLLGYDWLAGMLAAPRPAFRRLLAVSAPGLLFACGLCLLTLFRIIYYGDVVPNTFYAKVGGIPVIRGWIYLRNALVDGPALLLPGAVAAAAWLPRFRPALIYAVATACYVVAIGGDVFAVGRFMLPVLPMMLGGAVAGGRLALARNRVAGGVLLAALPACMLWSLFGTWPENWGRPDYDFSHENDVEYVVSAKRAAAKVHYIFYKTEDELKHAQLARILALRPAVHVVATVGIGKLGYWAPGLVIVDLVGLTDRHIAHSGRTLPGTVMYPGHSRTDAAYVLSRRPDFIELPRKGTPFLPLPAMIDLWNDPDLERDYQYDPSINGYVRKSPDALPAHRP